MAALIRHVLRKTGQQNLTKYEAARCYASVITKRGNNLKSNKIESGQRIDSVAESLASKGYLRSYKPYYPPSDLHDEIAKLCQTLNIQNKKASFSNAEQKYTFLELCFNKFQHGIPNSKLHEINNIENVINFYETTVNTTLPLDAMKAKDLPKNLHIQYEYHRFNSETDTKFGGQTAFPKSSTLVTGLKYKNKYQGNVAKRSWPN